MSAPAITQRPSPNFDSRDGQTIDMLVLHYTGMPTAREALDRLCDAQAKVSAHYVVDEDGTIYQLVAEENRAWHAGVSAWRGHSNINQRSIGIEIVNRGHEFGYHPFPVEQMKSVAALCKGVVSRHAIPKRNVVGHSDVAPTRKEDPGELFDWKMLATQKIGLWPRELRGKPSIFGMLAGFLMWCFSGDIFPAVSLPTKKNKAMYAIASGPLPSEEELKHRLESYGYDTADLPKTITAFQRHFFPKHLTGIWDHECVVLLAALTAML